MSEEYRVILGFIADSDAPTAISAVLDALHEHAEEHGPVVGWDRDGARLDVVLSLDAADAHAAVAATVPLARSALRSAGVSRRLISAQATLTATGEPPARLRRRLDTRSA